MGGRKRLSGMPRAGSVPVDAVTDRLVVGAGRSAYVSDHARVEPQH